MPSRGLLTFVLIIVFIYMLTLISTYIVILQILKMSNQLNSLDTSVSHSLSQFLTVLTRFPLVRPPRHSSLARSLRPSLVRQPTSYVPLSSVQTNIGLPPIRVVLTFIASIKFIYLAPAAKHLCGFEGSGWLSAWFQLA